MMTDDTAIEGGGFPQIAFTAAVIPSQADEMTMEQQIELNRQHLAILSEIYGTPIAGVLVTPEDEENILITPEEGSQE